MYERSAIILERYYNKILGLDEKVNLKTIFADYKEIIEEMQKYQSILKIEDKVINEFDETANDIRIIQQEQKRINKSNIKNEEEINQLFNNLDEEPEIIEKKLKKAEENLDKNNKRLQELRESYIKSLTEFSSKQKERNKCSRERRTEEKEHIQIIEKSENDIKEINTSLLKNIKEFQKSEDESYKQGITEIMINNGKDERVPFNKEVLKNAIDIRNKIATKEAECYTSIYDKMKKILADINSDEIQLEKYIKALRDVSVKLSFLNAQKMYIASFLDNERMTAINGKKVHDKLMQEVCENFKLDTEQFNNLYELILKETLGKATKKLYTELYNKEYLRNIEENEKNLEQKINNMKIKSGTIINSNYWRIEEIKNVYQVFQNEISEKFGKDLSGFKLEEIYEVDEDSEEIVEEKNETKDDIFKSEIPEEDIEYIEEFEEDYDDDEYDEEDYEDEDYEEEDEEDYEDDDYEEENDEDYEDDDYEEEDDEDYEEEDEEDYEYDDYEEDDEEDYEDDDYEDYDDEYEEDEEQYDDDNDENYKIDDSSNKENNKQNRENNNEIKNNKKNNAKDTKNKKKNKEENKEKSKEENKKEKGFFKFFKDKK